MKTDKVIPFILALAAISLTGCKHQETLIGISASQSTSAFQSCGQTTITEPLLMQR